MQRFSFSAFQKKVGRRRSARAVSFQRFSFQRFSMQPFTRFLILMLVAVVSVNRGTNISFTSTAPAVVHPGMWIYFQARALDSAGGSFGFEYELLSGPTNVMTFTGNDRGVQTLVFDWQVSASLLGTTPEFFIRVSSPGDPSLLVTNVLRIPVVAPPPIHSLLLSNNLPVLTVTNLPVALSYEIQAATSVTASNWTVLTTTPYYAAQTRFVDTSATNHVARFYRLRPVGYTCNTVNCP